MTDDTFLDAFKAMCTAHHSLRFLTSSTTHSFEDLVVAHFMKSSASEWNATRKQWDLGKTCGATAIEQLHVLRCYTGNLPPLFAVINLDARLAAHACRSHPTRAYNATILEAASSLPPLSDGTYYRGMSAAEMEWYMSGGALATHLMSCSSTSDGAKRFGVRVIRIIVEGALAVRLAELSQAAADEAEIVIVPTQDTCCHPIIVRNGGVTQLEGLVISNANPTTNATTIAVDPALEQALEIAGASCH